MVVVMTPVIVTAMALFLAAVSFSETPDSVVPWATTAASRMHFWRWVI